MSEKRMKAQQGVICRLPGERFSYFGWPTVARMDDGTLVVASSGLRAEHVCPFGKTVLNTSNNDRAAFFVHSKLGASSDGESSEIADRG